ncbi:MAG: HAMP domain-containing protein [Deltaproteobacteria bacterium]|nr:HAMP domain-containing protein [Deltaproteobacteria bacterium]
MTKERDVLNDLLKTHGQSLSNTIAVVCIETLLSEDYPVLDTFLQTTGRERDDILSIEVIQNGQTVSNYVAGDEDLADRVIFNSDVLFAMQTDQPPIKLGEIRLGLSDRQNKKIIASRMRELIANTAVIFILLSGTLMLVLRKIVLKKIRYLSDHARRIGAGNLDLKIDLQTDDELGKLAQTFNDMVVTIKASQEELKLHQEHLELLVKERTRELEEAQEEIVGKAMEAARAQLAAMVLHNIGNAMTPINVQIEGMKAGQSEAVVQYLEKCYHDLKANIADLNTYVNADPRGQEIFRYMGELIAAVRAERNRSGDALEKMDRAISYVSEILIMQQAYAASEQEFKQRVDLHALIDDAIQIQMGSLERKGIVVEQKLDDHLPMVLLDKNRLMQVIINLIKNSSEAFERLEPDNRKKTIRIKTFAGNGHVGFEIADNGIGIDQENIDHIFDFGKSYQRSSGIGLYYCKMFVEDNGGTLDVSSPASGQGITVRVTFKKHA